MNRRINAIFLIFVLLAISFHGDASTSQKSLKLGGDFFEIAIPLTAFSSTVWLKDGEGSQEFLKGIVATGATTYGLKWMVNTKRPNHTHHSFPSGHAAIAFFGSGFIHKRYGWQYAIPAYAAASFVAYSRVKTKEHWIEDVIAGAAIGLLYSYLFTTPYDAQSYHLYPSITSHSVALLCEKNF